MEKSARGLPPLKGTKLSKKSKERQHEIQNKLNESNGRWNDWKLQLHWNKLEWVDNKSNPKRVKPFLFIQKLFILIKLIEQLSLLAVCWPL